MALFILICLGVAYLLYVRRWEPLTITLFGSLAGLAVVSLLSHTWTDDTLAYTWWGLAGIAMVPLDMPKPEPETDKKPVKAKRAVKA